MKTTEQAGSKSDPRFKNRAISATNINEYLNTYSERLFAALKKVDSQQLQKAFDLMTTCFQNRGHVFSAGNGGSSAISDHLCCDWMKGTQAQANDERSLKVTSLVSNMSLFSAIANDHGYDQVFSKPLRWMGGANDLCLLISSSGNSPNVIQAAEAALDKKINLITMTGFDGGKLRQMGHANLYVPEHNYGIVEDAHQILMHTLAQYFANLRDKKEL